MVFGEFFIQLSAHLYKVHSYENGTAYRADLPDAELASEEFRSRLFQSQRSRVPHWEAVLSTPYVRDRAWFWHRHHGACNLDMIYENDPAILAYAFRLGWSWDDAIRSVGLDPRKERIHKKRFLIPKAEILTHLRSRHEQGLSTPFDRILIEFPSLKDSIRAEFGSITRALKAAGLPDNRLKGPVRQAASTIPTSAPCWTPCALFLRRAIPCSGTPSLMSIPFWPPPWKLTSPTSPPA